MRLIQFSSSQIHCHDSIMIPWTFHIWHYLPAHSAELWVFSYMAQKPIKVTATERGINYAWLGLQIIRIQELIRMPCLVCMIFYACLEPYRDLATSKFIGLLQYYSLICSYKGKGNVYKLISDGKTEATSCQSKLMLGLVGYHGLWASHNTFNTGFVKS